MRCSALETLASTENHKQIRSIYPVCHSYATLLSLARRILLVQDQDILILPHLHSPSCTMGLCKDFWPVLPFPTHSSSLPCVLERDHLAPCSCSCFCSGTRIQPCKGLFSPMNSWSVASLSPTAQERETLALSSWSPGSADGCEPVPHLGLGWGELPTVHMWRKDNCPKLAAWSTKTCCPTSCPAAWGAQQLQEALWCQQLHLQESR